MTFEWLMTTFQVKVVIQVNYRVSSGKGIISPHLSKRANLTGTILYQIQRSCRTSRTKTSFFKIVFYGAFTHLKSELFQELETKINEPPLWFFLSDRSRSSAVTIVSIFSAILRLQCDQTCNVMVTFGISSINITVLAYSSGFKFSDV